MRYAWLAFEVIDDEGLSRGSEAVQRMLSAESVSEVIEQANAVLTSMGVSFNRFSERSYHHYPGEVELGPPGLVARLYACNATGLNYYEGREPVGE